MNKAIAIVLLTAFGLAAQAPASTKATTRKATAAAKKATAKKAAAAAKPATRMVQPLTIPKGAVARPDGTYSWTDKQGKNWTFAKTPFGVMKTATASAPADNTSLAGVKAIDAGDKVRFETPTPFGIVKREKNKTDLTDEERSLYDSQNPGQPAKQD